MTDFKESISLRVLEEVFPGDRSFVRIFGKIERNRPESRVSWGMRVPRDNEL
jgi:hypothetical protein